MSKKIHFNIQEYLSIRSELIQRISIINAQSHTAILTIITAFSAGMMLNYNTINNENNVIEFVALNIIRSVIFLIPIIYLIPLSVKSGENLIQLASISAYIRVFYDYLSTDKNKMNWETSNNILSNANVDRGKLSLSMKFYNEEYTILAIISYALYIVFSSVSIIGIKAVMSIKLWIVFIVIYVIMGIGSIVAIIFIHKSSGIKYSLMKYTPIYIEGYIKRAVQLGAIKKATLIA